MPENKVDISWLFELYKPRMDMISKNDCISISSTSLAYAFSWYFSDSRSLKIFFLSACNNVFNKIVGHKKLEQL